MQPGHLTEQKIQDRKKKKKSSIYGRIFHQWLGGKEFACNAGDLGQKDPLKEVVATHSRILAGKISWTEQPGGVQSTGSQRAGHD